MPSPQETALIFDLDNTLIHSTIDFPGVRRRLIDLLEARGVAPQPRADLMALAIPQLVAAGESVDAALGAQMWEIVAEAESAGLRGALPDPDAASVLRALRDRGYRLAVLTNNARPGVVEKLREFALTEFFEVIATRTEVAALKPSPAGVRYILARMAGVRTAYFVGDAWIDGVAAREAGIPFIGIGPREAVARERGAQPVTWIRSLQELLTLDLTRGA